MTNPDILREKLTHYAKYISYLRSFLLGALVLLFGWLKLRNAVWFQFARSVEAHTVTVAAMVLYFASWAAGSEFDIKLRKENYVIPPSARAFGWLFPLYVGLAVGFGLLCWVVTTPAQFAAFLLLFWALNWFGWWRATVTLFPNVLSATGLDAKPEVRARLAALEKYESGSWQWRRFGAGAILIVLLNLSGVGQFGVLAAQRLSWPADLLFAVSILVFVCAMEGWMWFWRTRVHFTLAAVRWLAGRFEIGPARS